MVIGEELRRISRVRIPDSKFQIQELLRDSEFPDEELFPDSKFKMKSEVRILGSTYGFQALEGKHVGEVMQGLWQTRASWQRDSAKPALAPSLN